MNKIFVCWDIHWHQIWTWDARKISKKIWTSSRRLTKDDVLVILWDFWHLWYTLWTNKSQEYNLDLLAGLNYTIAVVPWNHENYNEIFWLSETDKWWAKVWELKRKTGSIYFLQRWEVYNINWRKILAIGGAKSTDKTMRKEDKDWWQLEYLTEAEKNKTIENIKKHKRFDYIFSHTCPKSLIPYFLWNKDCSLKMNDEVAIFLEYIWKELNPEFNQRYFGHLHIDKCTDNNKFCCHYNNIPKELL